MSQVRYRMEDPLDHQWTSPGLAHQPHALLQEQHKYTKIKLYFSTVLNTFDTLYTGYGKTELCMFCRNVKSMWRSQISKQ